MPRQLRRKHHRVVLASAAGSLALWGLAAMAASHPRTGRDDGRLAGDYRLTPGLVVAIRRHSGRLTLSLADHKMLPMEPAGGDAYRVEALDATVSFRRGTAGDAAELTLVRYGERVVARRLGDAQRAARDPPQENPLRIVESLTPKLMVSLNVPGVSVAAIRRCRVVWHREFGLRHARKPERVAQDTLFEACSMSKTPFAYVALKLVEQGKLDLDRPLVEHLGQPYLAEEPRHRKITARMVLTHTTGLPNWRKGGWQKGGPLPVLFEPGTRFGYSGEGFLFLQRVAEHVTGQALEPLMRQRLLDPLGMRLSSYAWQSRYETLAARGHDATGKPSRRRVRFRHANAAFSLYTTPTEYAAFLIEILKRDRSAAHSLGRRSLDAMLEPAVLAPDRKPIQRGERACAPIHWGLGWPMTTTSTGRRYHHGGSNGQRFRCVCEFDPDAGSGFVLMSNGAAGEALWRTLIAAISTP